MRSSSSPGRARSTGMSKMCDSECRRLGASWRTTIGGNVVDPYAAARMPTVAFDARDAHAAPLRGWGRHARCLLAGLRSIGAPVREIDGRWPGPEAVWEQVALPLGALRRRDAVLHVPNCFLPLVRPCPGVVTLHDLAFEAFPEDFAPRTRWKYRVLARAAARSAQRVICVSRFTARDAAARWGLDASRIRVVPNAPAPPVGDAPVPPGDYVLGIGDLRAKKGWDTLARACRDLDLRCVVAGADAGEGERLRALRAELPGSADAARLDALLRGALVLVHPSRYEGFGLVVVEAMARGVPVVCADAT